MTKGQFKNYILFVWRWKNAVHGSYIRFGEVWLIKNPRPTKLYFHTIFHSYRLKWSWGKIRLQRKTPVVRSYWHYWKTEYTGQDAVDQFEAYTQIPFSEEMGLEYLLEA